MAQWDHLWIHLDVATADPSVDAPYGLLRDHAIAIKDGRIVAVLPSDEADPHLAAQVHHGEGRLAVPGFTDCHTHLVFGGDRAWEFEERLRGTPYTEIAQRGGGILSSVKATRAASEDELVETALPRAKALLAEGTTRIEIKSGYGLTLDDELKCLRAARRLGELLPVEISTTLLSAHAVPPEYKGRADDYVDHVCEVIIPAAAKAGLADAVDVFTEGIGFSLAQTRKVFEAAKAHGLAIKGHTEQLSNLGGTALAASMGALSADHLEYLDQAGVDAMAASGTVAALLPGAFYFLRETTKPPIQALRDAGVPMALATDFNPGTSPFASLRWMMSQACVLFGLTPEEAFLGVTRHGAAALGFEDEGRIAPGCKAHFNLFALNHPNLLAYQPGLPAPAVRIFRGEVVDA